MKCSLPFIICLTFYCCTSVHSQSENDRTPEDINKQFFELYDSQGPREALDFLFATNDWIKGDKKQITDLHDKLVGFTSHLGSYRGEELITKKSIGKNLSLYTYLLKFDRQPLRCNHVL